MAESFKLSLSNRKDNPPHIQYIDSDGRTERVEFMYFSGSVGDESKGETILVPKNPEKISAGMMKKFESLVEEYDLRIEPLSKVDGQRIEPR